MESYTTQITVKQEHLDQLHHVNNIQYVSWVQDIAITHWEKAITEHIRNSYFWVLLQHSISYKKPAFLNDVIEVKTFIKSAKGVRSIRCVEFYNSETQTLLATSDTTWCLFNKENKKPTRITEDILNCFN
ncbi:acyl-CoA thioesterase [Aurantibacter sp.]|uniref:acyl-CoA thioesterase n=1 Tax=Aurantibacter sp. TaxID=2807103 RepID=UPI0035C7B9B5